MSISYEELIRMRHLQIEQETRSKSVDANNNNAIENKNISKSSVRTKSNKLEPLKSLNIHSLKRASKFHAEQQYLKNHHAAVNAKGTNLTDKQHATGSYSNTTNNINSINHTNQNTQMMLTSKLLLQPVPPSQLSASAQLLPSTSYSAHLVPTPPLQSIAPTQRADKDALATFHRQAYAKSTVPKEVEPKVMAPRITVRGELPREEIVRRKRARYDSYPDVQTLLQMCSTPSANAMHISASAMKAEDNQADGNQGKICNVNVYHSLLPLHAFDDNALDEFTSEEWKQRLKLIRDRCIDKSALCGLPCKYFNINEENNSGDVQNISVTWRDGLVVDWDVVTNTLVVIPADMTSESCVESCIPSNVDNNNANVLKSLDGEREKNKSNYKRCSRDDIISNSECKATNNCTSKDAGHGNVHIDSTAGSNEAKCDEYGKANYDKQIRLHRIYVYLHAENVINFARRYFSAYRRRWAAEAILRTEITIRNVPIDEREMLDASVASRIHALALNTPRLSQNEAHLDCQGALANVRGEYAHVMNKDLLRRYTRRPECRLCSAHTPLLLQTKASPAPVYGIRPGLQSRFNQIVHAFDHNSILARDGRLIHVMQYIRECNGKLMHQRAFLFDNELAAERPLSMITFDEMQMNAIRDSAMYVRDNWYAHIKSYLKQTLSACTQDDDVHLLIYEEDTYNKSMTRRFLQSVNLIMYDALKHCLMTNMECFTRFIEGSANYDVDIDSIERIRVSRGTHFVGEGPFGHDVRISARFLRGKPYEVGPLLKITLLDNTMNAVTAKNGDKKSNNDNNNNNNTTSTTVKHKVAQDQQTNLSKGESLEHPEDDEGKAEPEHKEAIDYTTTENNLRTTLTSLLKRYIAAHIDVRAMDRQLFDFVYDDGIAFAELFNSQHPLVQSCVARINDVVDRVYNVMTRYRATFNAYEDIASLNVAEYKKQFNETFPHTKGVDAEIRRFMALQQSVLERIPVHVHLGMVLVDCEELRRRLSTKCAQVISSILDEMSSRATDLEDTLEDEFTSLHERLIAATDTPEEVVATKDFIKTIPEKLIDLQTTLHSVNEIHILLDTFQRPLNEEEFDKKWRAIGWPAMLDDAVNQRAQELEETKRCLIATMRRAQDGFVKEIEVLQRIIASYDLHSNFNKQDEIAADVTLTLEKIAHLRERANTFNMHESLFNLEKTNYSQVHQLSVDFEPYASLWLTAHEWTSALSAWHSMPFVEINAEEMEEKVTEHLRTIVKCTRETRLTPELIRIAERVRESINQFRPIVPTVKWLRTEGLKERHWTQLSKELDKEIRPGTTLRKLDDIAALNLFDQSRVLMSISEVAAREYQIETTLNKMQSEWDSMQFELKEHKTTGCFIIAKDKVDTTQELLDDQTLTTQALSFSPFKKIFELEIASWEKSLKTVQDVLDEWLPCQKSWLYLEPIFQSEDIARQLPAEYKRFQKVSENWKWITSTAHYVDLIIQFCTKTERVVEVLRESNNLLEEVEHGLNQYLENKRASFARFYFLSDDELLTILSEARDVPKMQPQFRKLFENVARIDMREPDHEMFGMYSHMNEYVPFTKSVLPRKYVENWLTEIEHMMKISIRSSLERGMRDVVNMTRKEFILQAPGQVAIAINQIMWTHECERALMEYGSLQSYVPRAKENLMILVETVRQPLSHLQRMNLSGLITIEVHARDIVDKLVEENVNSVLAFEWISQLRSYWENNDCTLRQIEAQFRYGGEYLGNTTRLVVTPLTDRIYLTLTGAMHMFLGGAPAGPAGTGKTETVKDLAKATAKQCVVFNCQEGMTYGSMGKFFKGLAQAGAWACFDEFNRIDVEVLSVVAQQVGSLQEAARTRQYRIPFEGTEIVVDPSYAVFITMNPGYAGRTELPDNLKVLFRPVACMVPDYAMIAEIRLFSFGYADSRKLAQKMVATFRLSSEQLSSQDHYDFGMRAVNTVISAAGLMKRECPDEDEDVLLLRALRDSNAPKFLEQDLFLFSGIISDLFPGVALTSIDYGNFDAVLRDEAAKLHLQPTEMFVKKCRELYEMSVLRHGQMIVGPAMGGKTCATNVLQLAMTRMRSEEHSDRFAVVKTHALNPKSITMAQLYGGFDEVTGEWRDGLVGELFRLSAKDSSDTRHWIIFDGPVDALWIESMNTVLDDNKKLCLISGEIIMMTPYMNCWFEVEDLAVASPATVSRAGMIYMEPNTCIGVTSFVKSWHMYHLPPTMTPYKESLQSLCDELFPPLIHFIKTQVNEYCSSLWPNLIVSCMNLYNALLKPFTPTRTVDVPEDKLEQLREVYLHLFVFAIIWSFGATGDAESRIKFDAFLREELEILKIPIELPIIGCLQDYEFVLDEQRWVAWNDRLPVFNTQVTQTNMSDLIVPTADVARYKYVSKTLIENGFHVLCCGPTGTGKTVLLQQLLLSEMPKEFTPIFFTFSARTSANQTQDLIFSKFEVRRRASPQLWGAPVNKKFVIFIDDANMPMKEQYGAQPPIELLRQFLDYHGWYDRKTREFFGIVDVLLVAAMGPPGGGRNHVSHRFLRHFTQIGFPEIDDVNMRRIFTTLLESYFAPFTNDIRGSILSLITASIEVYNTVIKELRPTPAKAHYLFNLRDLAKVMDGMVNAVPKVYLTVNDIVRLWMHEEMRTFKDRLINQEDRIWFDTLLETQLGKHFQMTVRDVLTSCQEDCRTNDSSGDNDVNEDNRQVEQSSTHALQDLLFVDFAHGLNANRVYSVVNNFNSLVHTVEEQLTECNALAAGQELKLVLFHAAIHHLCRIARVLRKYNGHCLLLGVGGSGRQSLSRLAAFLNDFDTTKVEISRGYTVNAWREDLKTMLRQAAFKHRQLLFIFCDTQIVFESMLEDVNNLLNAGEVPNLFVGQEFDDVLTTMRPICVQEGVPLDKVNIYARFVRACRSNLHISLCMSPLGEPFRNRLRMFPALVNCCTIDWFAAWPHEALHGVARSILSSEVVGVGNQNNDNSNNNKGSSSQLTRKASSSTTMTGYTAIDASDYLLAWTSVCVKIHESVEHMAELFYTETGRQVYVTPTSFLELLHTFASLLAEQTNANIAHRNRLENGLLKLKETEDAVAGLQQTLAESQPVLLEKAEAIKNLVQEMGEQTASAEITKHEAQRERESVAEMQAECASIEQAAQEQLSEALPELDRALETLKNLKSSQITEVAGYKAPTPGVVMTVQGICILFQIKPIYRATNAMEEKKPDYWATAREQLLNNPNLLMQRLINYDKEHIPERLIQAVMPLVSSEDFTPKKIATASQACAAMCQWTHAMVRFHEVNKKVEPLRQRLAVAQAANQEAMAKLFGAEQRLEEVARTLAALNARKDSAEREMQELEETVKITEIKLERAEQLINGLADEKKNWARTLETLSRDSTLLAGNMLTAAGQIAYCGPFTSSYRAALLQEWQVALDREHIAHSDRLSIFYTLQDPVQTRQWELNGLPTDAVSIENALILTHARRWPLMIDPQTQANKWIRQTYKDSLEVLKPTQKDLIKRIEYSIRAGRPVLLENVTEELDGSLNPLLARQTFMQGGTEMIRISDTAIPWNAKFKFFMTTKWANPRYTPEVMVRVTLLNFFITQHGLEEQLLGVVVGQERKELETRRNDLIQSNASMKEDLDNIQKTILRKLEEVKGDILDDVELIEYLNESKKTSTEIIAKVKEAEEAEVEINSSREVYRPIARHASCLYFCSSTLCNVDPMYQYSLQWFVQLFLSGIEQAAASDDVQCRLSNLQSYFTYSFYQNISRSLFEKHKLMFSFFLCLRLMQQDNRVDAHELRFLLQGPSLSENVVKPDEVSWMTATMWNELSYLARHFNVFNGFTEHIITHHDYYHDLFVASAAHEQPLYGDEWGHKLTALQHMMFLRCIRPDKLMAAVQVFVTSEMGERFIRPPPFDLLTSFKDSTPHTPLIFILSQGADPFDEWKRFAETQQMSKKLFDISLGQGQGPRAERMLQEGMENGAWVLLQNCHLATSWMPTLERLVESMSVNLHPSFRLWLTSMPSSHFPVSVLQNGVKMTNEPPKGMQANVTRSLLTYNNDYLESCLKPVEFKKLFFAMCFFHALVQERRKFGPLGWNIAYEYTSGDLNCCIAQIKMFLDKYDKVPYRVIRELSGNIHYGGRVTDDWDRRTLTTLLEKFVCPEVMENNYRFAELDTYVSTEATTQQNYLSYVASWPINTEPEVFGLHENADITCARSETFDTLAAVVALQGEGISSSSSSSLASSSSSSSEKVVTELAQTIQARVRAPFSIDKFQERYPTRYEDSMNTVVVQEAIRFNRLLNAIHTSLANLVLAIKGDVVMSKELEEMYKSMYTNQIPTQWAECAYPSLKPLASWVDDLVMRLDMIDAWYEKGHPMAFWISGFFFPQAFLTGILQNYARSMQISIDTISYDFEWIKTDVHALTAAPEKGCYVYGMYIEGARIDTSTMTLAESKPKVLFESSPMLWLKPTVNRTKPSYGIYECPLYKTVQRAGTLSTTGHSTNYVLTVEIPTNVDARHWVRRGVALLCALSS